MLNNVSKVEDYQTQSAFLLAPRDTEALLNHIAPDWNTHCYSTNRLFCDNFCGNNDVFAEDSNYKFLNVLRTSWQSLE